MKQIARRIALAITVLSVVVLLALSGDGQMERNFRKDVYSQVGIQVAPEHQEDGVVPWVIATLGCVAIVSFWFSMDEQ